MRSRLSKLVCSVRTTGLTHTIKLLKKNLLHEFRWYLDGAFDRRYGTRTSGIRELQTLGISSENARHGVYYEPTPTKIFLEILGGLGVRYEEFVFCDLGSGMGRTLLLASTFPFKEIVGVEFSETLHRQAVENIRVYRNRAQRCFAVRSMCLDAVHYALPADPVVIFFYNPFAPPVMRKVLANIRQSLADHPRPMQLIYYNPLSAHLIEELGFLPHRRALSLSHDYSRAIQRDAVVYHN